jgi:protein-S-isoprenylcysteine O-methyltransferase Ste14
LWLCKQEGNATFSGITTPEVPPLPDYADFIARCIVFAAAHSLFATRRAKQFFGRVDGTEPRCYRLIYNLASLALFGWVMAAYRTSALLYEAYGAWRWLLHTGQLLAAVAILLCVRQTGAGNFLGIRGFRSSSTPPRRLVTSGWYAHVRHPLYLYSTLFLALNPVMTVQWALLTLFSVSYFIIGGMIEERRLLEEYGEAYRAYRERVPFLIPSFRIGKQQHP